MGRSRRGLRISSSPTVFPSQRREARFSSPSETRQTDRSTSLRARARSPRYSRPPSRSSSRSDGSWRRYGVDPLARTHELVALAIHSVDRHARGVRVPDAAERRIARSGIVGWRHSESHVGAAARPRLRFRRYRRTTSARAFGSFFCAGQSRDRQAALARSIVRRDHVHARRRAPADDDQSLARDRQAAQARRASLHRDASAQVREDSEPARRRCAGKSRSTSTTTRRTSIRCRSPRSWRRRGTSDS